MDEKQIAEQRLALCDQCPHLCHTMGARSCNLCGCFVNLKARMMSQSCPAGVWGPQSKGFFASLFGE